MNEGKSSTEFKGKPKHRPIPYEHVEKIDTIFLTMLALVALQDTRHTFTTHSLLLWTRLPLNLLAKHGDFR